MLGKLPDRELAALIGRTANAVSLKRTKLGIPTAVDLGVLGQHADGRLMPYHNRMRLSA